jgi:hypothetical protein
MLVTVMAKTKTIKKARVALEVFQTWAAEYRDIVWKNTKNGNSGDFHVDTKKGWKARLKGDRAVWGIGRSMNEAVGNVINSHPEYFNVDVVVMEGKS